MKIMLITTLYPGYIGQNRSEVSYAIHNFAMEWSKQGHDVSVIRPWITYPGVFSFSKKGKSANAYGYDECYDINGIDICRIIVKKIPKVDYIRCELHKVYENILRLNGKNKKPDIIVCHMINPSIYIGELLKNKYHVPLALVIHSSDIGLMQKRKHARKFKNVRNCIDVVMFRSKNLRNSYHEIFKNECFLNNQAIINSGVDERYIINETLLKEKANRKTTKVFVAANFLPLKNIDIVIQAFDSIGNSELFLEIAGDGKVREKLYKLAKQARLSENINFCGRIDRDDVIGKMRESDLFVLVSSPETFGLVYLEAMASGCVVVGSKGEGIDGIIDDGKNGFLCPPRDVHKLTMIIRRITSLSSEEKGKIINSAVSTARMMTNGKVAAEYIDILEKTRERINARI